MNIVVNFDKSVQESLKYDFLLDLHNVRSDFYQICHEMT